MTMNPLAALGYIFWVRPRPWLIEVAIIHYGDDVILFVQKSSSIMHTNIRHNSVQWACAYHNLVQIYHVSVIYI